MSIFDGYIPLYIAQSASVNAILVSGIVSSYLKKNFVPTNQLISLISIVGQTLDNVSHANRDGARSGIPQQPAVAINKSVTEEYIICLEDGKKFKSLKRHLAVKYDMTPEDYRAKWLLPGDYPMVAPAYTKVRSRLAKSVGLGRRR